MASLKRYLSIAISICVVALLASACGSRASLDDPDFEIVADAGVDGFVPPKTCGDNVCQSTETCTNCPNDCGLCKTCGNGKCDASESCNSCPQDCDTCPACGDGFCKAGEDCTTCAPDCGKCAACGDGKCNGTTETCFTCPDDCGKCVGCGDGTCKAGESCASCPHDCGVCSVCGNAKCEQFETCANCNQDCGQCTTLSCFQALTCAFKCVQLGSNPPNVSISCVANCLSLGCPDTQFFFDQAFNCAIQKGFGTCGGDFNCIQKECGPEIAACLGSTCN
ncbi:hypothetical protein BH09MYX1_BH09MYX1_63790 [soil metagenome]